MELSEVGIASAAMVHLGRDPIADLDGGDATSKLINERMPALRDQLLRAYPWNFALAYATLSTTALDAPLFGYTHKATLPAGGADPHCLKVKRVDTSATWSIKGRDLYISAAGPVSIEYIGRELNYEIWDPICAELLAVDLALALINKVASGDIRKTQGRLTSKRRDLRRAAYRADATEASPGEAFQAGGSSWANARRPK